MQQILINTPLEFSSRFSLILDAIPDIIVEVDTNKVYTWANRHGLEFFGDDMIGHEARYYFEDPQDIYSSVAALFAGSDETQYLETWQRRKDGQKRLLAWWCHVVKDDVGAVRGVISTARDITDQRQTEDSVSKSQLILKNIIDLLPVRIFWKDIQLHYLGCNRVFARDAGKNDPEELVGKDDYQMAWKDQAELYRADDLLVMNSGKAKLNYEEPQTTKTGQTLWLQTNKIPLLDKEKKVIGVVGTYQDITSMKNTEERLKQSENRLIKAQTIAHVGIWELNLHTNTVWASEEAFLIYGFERKTPEISLEQVQKIVLSKYRTLLDTSLQQLIENGKEYDLEFQITRASDAVIRYIHSKAEIVLDAKGKPEKVLGAIQDITDQKAAELGLQVKNAELERVNSTMVNRELRMIELKEKIKELEAKLQA